LLDVLGEHVAVSTRVSWLAPWQRSSALFKFLVAYKELDPTIRNIYRYEVSITARSEPVPGLGGASSAAAGSKIRLDV